MISIVRGTHEHISMIQDIAYKTWPITFSGILSAQQINYMLEIMYHESALLKQLDELGHHFLLAQKGTDYLGYSSYENHYKGLKQTKIHKIYILPETQGMGIGKKLIETVESIAKKEGSNELVLNVNKYNEAQRFYNRLGFKVVNTEDIDIGSGFLMEDKIMVKKLTR